MAQYENNGKSASDVYTATQLADGEDVALDQSWRNAGVHRQASDLSGDVQARELAENEIAREARQKIIAILEEDEPPARARTQPPANTGHLRRKNPGLELSDLMTADDMAAVGGGLHDAINNVGMDLFHEGYQGGDNEAAQMAESMAGRTLAEPTWDWKAVKSVATLRGGKQVPVWMVENTATGMQVNKPFRIQAPAERIVSLLNVTGNANDPRVKQIQEDYDQYVSLTRQYRKAKQLYESGDRDAGQTGKRVAVKLRGVKQRLGI